MKQPESSDAFEGALIAWRSAQVVTDRYGSEARQFLDQIAAEPEIYEERLVAVLEDSSQLVVAYSLLALDQMKSHALRSLPEPLLKRREQITMVIGSFKQSMDLGGLARQLAKKAKKTDSVLCRRSATQDSG